MKELLERIYQDVQSRKSWDEKQRRWYKMRFDGLGRSQLPWATAANLHYAVSDILINTFRPYYIEQLYSSELLARFVAKQKNHEINKATEAAQFFSYQLKENSNFETEIRIGIDKHLMQDVCPFKTRWDDKLRRVSFEAIDPIDFIVPPYTRNLQEADYCVHVLEIPKHIYRELNYRNDEDFIKRADGRENPDDSSSDMKAVREGLVDYQNKNQVILLWEIYRKKDGKTLVSTWSPFSEDKPAKEETQLLYNHGQYPFVPLVFEKTDRGYYSSRGITHIIAADEDVATKIWNNQMDRFDLTNRPIFTGVNPMPNTTNIKMRPGQYINGDVRVVEIPPSAWDYRAEMAAVLQRANDRVGSPDAGITNTQQPVLNPRTKFEVSQIAGLNNAKLGDRGRLFRKCLTEIFEQAWSLMVQFKDDLNMDIYLNDDQKTIEKSVLEDAYMIRPSCSADGMTKEAQLQKAVMRFQLWTQNPYANQSVLAKSVMELDDPSFAKEVFIDPKITEQNQVKRQQEEIVMLRNGFQVPLNADDRDEIHLNVILGVVAQQWGAGQAARQAWGMYEAHAMDHLERLRVQKPDMIYEAYRRKINDLINADAKLQREVLGKNGGQHVPMAS